MSVISDDECIALNRIRRAFDSGELSFDRPSSRNSSDELVVNEVPPNSGDFASDPPARMLILHRAYWEGYKYNPRPGGNLWLDFAGPLDLDYLGASQTAVSRNVWVLSQRGLLQLSGVGWSVAKPTGELITAYESGALFEQGKERIFAVGSQFDSYREIKNILLLAKSELFIIDNYVDDSLFDRLTVVESQVSIKVLTERLPPDFGTAIKKFTEQYSYGIEVRTHTGQIHDRFIDVDKRDCYSLGASIKDAGKKLWVLQKLADPQPICTLRTVLSETWNSATTVWPRP